MAPRIGWTREEDGENLNRWSGFFGTRACRRPSRPAAYGARTEQALPTAALYAAIVVCRTRVLVWSAQPQQTLREKSENNRVIRVNSKAIESNRARQIHLFVAGRTSSICSAYSASSAAYELSWPVNSSRLHVEVNFYGSVKRHS